MLYCFNMTPQKQTTSAAKDVFSYLLMIIMLYVGVISFIAMIWQYINIRFPDVLTFYFTGASEIIRGSISALLIVWPVMIFVSWMIGKDLIKHEEKKDMWIRKWLLYLTLFIAALTIIIDLITTTNSFLNGDMTIQFSLKVLVILLVAICVFSYYLWDLKRDIKKTKSISRLVAILTSVIILISIIGGFFLVGSPAKQRLMRFDEQRVQDLQMIQGQIINHWTQKAKIPKMLAELNDSVSGFVVPMDPETKQPYEYQIKTEHDFVLCATFANKSDAKNGRYGMMATPSFVGGGMVENWSHESGYTCFSRTIDPELYRPVSKDAVNK